MRKNNLTFFAITVFYFFEFSQMSYFNVLAPYFLMHHIYSHAQIGSLSASYYYGDVAGLLPVGWMLDRFSLRRCLLWAITGSILAAFLLYCASDFYLQWIARFFCGFFGGTFSFVGGIRIISALFSRRFTLFIGLFLSAGMLGGLLCQYPLLITANRFGTSDAMLSVATFGLFVMVINFLFLRPIEHEKRDKTSLLNQNQLIRTLFFIMKRRQNWLDCVMVILLDTPVSIIGTLWGVVILTTVYHFSDTTSAWIVMSLFVGLIMGLPIWGVIADRFHHTPWVILVGASVSFFILIVMLFVPTLSFIDMLGLFFMLGFFSACQSLGFTWLTQNMKPELVGTNSAFNSMLLMGGNGLTKQIGAYLLSISPFLSDRSVGVNVIIFMASVMLLTVVYVLMRTEFFRRTSVVTLSG